MKHKKRNVLECEVCGTEASCIETEDGIFVCSETCRALAEGTSSHIPLDTMFNALGGGYFGLGDLI